jgi:hypothetical protein
MLMIEVLRIEDRGKFSLLSSLSSLRGGLKPSLNKDLLVSHLERKLRSALIAIIPFTKSHTTVGAIRESPLPLHNSKLIS